MKFSIKDLFFLFLAVLFGGLGILEGIRSFFGVTLVLIGSIGVSVILCHKFFGFWRNHGKYKKIAEKTSTKKQNQPIIAQLSSEINESLWHLRQFERDYHRAKKGFDQPGDFSEIARTEMKRSEVLPVEFRLSLPNWYKTTIEQHSLFDLIPKKKARVVEQFYQNLSDIKELHNQIKETIKKEKAVNQVLDDVKQFEDLIRKVLDQGNPLKTT